MSIRLSNFNIDASRTGIDLKLEFHKLVRDDKEGSTSSLVSSVVLSSLVSSVVLSLLVSSVVLSSLVSSVVLGYLEALSALNEIFISAPVQDVVKINSKHPRIDKR